jgi:Tol biopolymer transport system component/DNA-binding winged helix-turn-helix (wHTH) protein
VKDKQIQGFYEFASFRLDIKKRRLTRDGEVVPLTPKEFDVLFFLVENAGRIVEKDELLGTVWKNTFVEEGTLARNVSWLRKKLAAGGADDAKLIETLPKRGYRFSPQVTRTENALIIEEQTVQHVEIEEIIEIEPLSGESDLVKINQADVTAGHHKYLSAPQTKTRFSGAWILVGVLVLSFIALVSYQTYFSEKQTKVLLASKIAPFSGLPGRENSPAFSPDGKQIVFTWDGGIEGGNADVYVKLVGTGEPVRITNTETEEINPVFSPDGRSIAFVRVFQTHNEIILIPALGGAENRIYDKASYASLSFSPDGKLLAHADLDLSNNDAGIFTINVETGEKNNLTTPEAPAVDHTPRFSPDGKSLAFIRYFNSFRREIFVMPASGGEPRQVTSDDVRVYGLAWNADSEKIFFTSFRDTNQLNLWLVPLQSHQEPQLIPTGARELQSVTLSPDGRTLAFVEQTIDENIWQMQSNDADKMEMQPLICSTRADHSQQFSPDGSEIVFASDRTGNYEIWLADAEGKTYRQLTDSNDSAGSPRFSPDAKFVAYDGQIAGGSDIYVVSANGGSPRRLTENGKNNSMPAWGADGKWIFFISNRSGSDQIWKIPVTGGDAVQVTRRGAFEMFVTADGKRLIYSKGGGKAGLWSVNIDGSGEQPVSELAEAGIWRSWFVAANGVYYTAFSAQPPFRVKFFDFATRETKEITRVAKSPLSYYQNLSVSPDGKKILYARQDQSASAIMLAELN